VPVYVDDMRAPFGQMIMCHMIADTTAELLAIADRIGVARKWVQDAGMPSEHFDIALTKRKLAVAAGAQEISTRDLVGKIRDKKLAYHGYDSRPPTL
jgi:hypothetical protein